MEKDIKENYVLGITHSGRFHADDVFSTVLLKTLFPDIKIVRKSEVSPDDRKDGVIIYDIGGGEFDHHKKDKELNESGIPYSAFGLLWRKYGKAYLGKEKFKNVKLANRLFIEKYVSKIDKGDNFGYEGVKRFAENEMIKCFNPKWYESADSDTCFMRAVEFAEGVLSNWTRETFETIEMQKKEDEIWEKTKSASKNGVFVFEEGIPWKAVAKRHSEDGLLVAIGKSNRNGYYVMPAENSGIIVPEDARLSFRHSAGFMGIADDLDTAIAVAQDIVDKSKSANYM